MIFHHPQPKMYLRILIFLAFSFEGVFSGCPGGWTESNGGCFQVFIQATPLGNVASARAVCQQKGSDIASLASSSDATLVAQLVANQTRYAGAASTAYAYIGFSDIATAGVFDWMDGSSYSYNNVSEQSKTQHFIPGDRRCVALHSSDGNWFPNLTNVEWTLVPCCFDIYDVNAVVCSNPNATNANSQPDLVRSYCYGACPKDWHKLNSTCYYVTDLTRMLNDSVDARQECLRRSADLPSIRSAAEDAHLAYMMREAGKRENASCVSVYQGLNDISTSGSYQYTDKTPATYTSWASGEPSRSATPDNRTEACATATWTENYNNATTWKDVSCCTSASVYWLACQLPENGTMAVAPADNIFAVKCSDVNECLSVPCLNNGTCYNGVLYYNCTCLLGYTGTNCETEINYCISSPCQNNGTCVRHVGYYTCNCVPGTTGTNCETISDYCLSHPCYNNGNCTSLPSNFKCDCVAGITGTRCETNIDDCSSSPCLNGGTCLDRINGFTCSCPPSYTGSKCETKLNCQVLPYEANNATQRNTSSSDSNVVTYCCNDDRYRFPDMTSCQTVVCLATGGWNATIGTCGPHCAQLPFVLNADIGNANTAVGNTVNFTCLKGYMLWNNQTSINTTCLPNGNWSEDLTGVTCDVVVCPPLPQWPRQSMDTRNTTYDTTVTFWCDVGYVLYDNTTARTIKCIADATWTADLPPCLPVQCPVISLPSGVNRNTSDNTYMTYAKYWCNNGLRMLDGSTYRVILCDAGAEWSDTISDCRADRCFPLPYVANATPSATDANHWNTSTLTCIKGHRLIINGDEKSSDVMTCQTNGWWYPILPSCEPILCPPVPKANNIIASTDSRLFETVVTYNCVRGYYINPADFSNQLQIECLESKNWNNTAIPDCTPIHCSSPPDIVNGTRSAVTDTVYATEVKYTCDSGTKFLDGRVVKNLRCNETGQWNETDVSCRSDRCNPVNVTAHSTPDTTNTSWYTNVTYRCNPGYEWSNRVTVTIMCNAGGDWNATFSATDDCKVKLCPDVPLMPNATTNTTDHIFDTVVDYECDVGFKYSDNTTSKTIRCAEDATWQPSVRETCQIIHCPSLDDVENATRDSNDTCYSRVIIYSCLPGYQYPDKLKNKTVTCQANETWTSFPPPCGVVFCPPLPYWTSAIFNTTDNNFLSAVSYTCADGSAFKSNMSKPGNQTVLTSMCLSTKQWVPAIQDCVAVAAINADLVGKSYESPQSVPIGTVACTILCIVLALVILLDLSKIISDLRMLRDNVSSLIDNRKRNKVGNSPRS